MYYSLRLLLCTLSFPFLLSFFFFNDPATTEIYTLSLHDALPILGAHEAVLDRRVRIPRLVRILVVVAMMCGPPDRPALDRKSTRLNSSHTVISYAVFCLKKKKKKTY